MLPARNATILGQAMSAGRLYTVAGTGVCGTSGQGGPVAAAQLWDPVAVAVDGAGDLLVADSGDQSVLLAPPAAGGTFYGRQVGAGDIGVVMGGTGSYGPYLSDGLSATGPAAELNDPRSLAVGPTGALFVTDGFMHVIRVVPDSAGLLLGRTMTADGRYTAAGVTVYSVAGGNGRALGGQRELPLHHRLRTQYSASSMTVRSTNSGGPSKRSAIVARTPSSACCRAGSCSRAACPLLALEDHEVVHAARILVVPRRRRSQRTRARPFCRTQLLVQARQALFLARFQAHDDELSPHVGTFTFGRCLGGDRCSPLQDPSYDVQVVPVGGVNPFTRYACTYPRTQAL